MQMIDTADLLVADLTDDNPNVYYELSARHSLGLPYALISQHDIRFDIAGLRYVKYSPDALADQAMRKELKKYLKAQHQVVLSRGDVDNPITNFYGVPLAEVSPASGLGLGYYRNFVRNIEDIIEKSEVVVNGETLDETGKRGIRLDVLIPNRLIGAYHKNIKDLLIEPGTVVSAEIRTESAGRPFTLYARPDSTDGVVLVDIPTALNALEDAITGRYSAVRLDKESEEWRRLERQEIERFSDTIRRRLANEERVSIKRMVRLVPWEVDSSL
jgi:hypothetical protein